MGIQFSPGCECCGQRILAWGDTGLTCLGNAAGPGDIFSFYTSISDLNNPYIIDDNQSYTGSIKDYTLIFWFYPNKSVPWSWNNFSGRAHLITENKECYAPDKFFNLSLGPLIGMTIVPDVLDSICQTAARGSTTSDLLTGGQPFIGMAATSQVSGGTAIAKTSNGKVWLAHNKVNNVDFVVAGDGNHLGGCIYFQKGGINEKFGRALINVPV